MPEARIDDASSGSCFDGWIQRSASTRIEVSTPEKMGVAKAVHWFLRVAWRKLRLIDLKTVPGYR